MADSNHVYRQLQKHLDKQPVGYPKTITGSDLKLLKHIFTPYEAELAMSLDYKFSPVDAILPKVNQPGLSEEDLKQQLFELAKKGGVGYRDKDGDELYANIPLIVGMYEGYLEKLSPEFLKDFSKYTNSISYGISFLATNKVQMRTIPVEESVTPENNISQFDEVIQLLEKSEGPFIAVSCICRKGKKMEGATCTATDRVDTCLVVNELAKGVQKAGVGSNLSKEEAIDLIRKNTEEGLILQPSNTQEIDFICSCCGCCCGMLNVHKKLPNPADYWATNFYSEIDHDNCNGCGICAKKCQVDAIKFKKIKGKKNKVSVNLRKCLGCGNCVVSCKFDGIHLVKKESIRKPPKNHDDLYETIMQAKNDKWGTFKTVTKAALGIPQSNDR